MSVTNVSAGSTRFLLRSEGSGPGTPVLLLHGVPETSSVWRAVAPELAQGRRVLVPDLPGLGGSSYPGPYDVASLVEQLAALVEAEVPDGRIDVVGHDWGGTLALALTAARPGLVRRLCVSNTAFRSIPLHRAFHVPFFALPLAPELLFRLGGRHVVDAMLDYAWKADGTLDPAVRAEYRAAYTDPVKVAAMLGYYRGVTRPKLAALLRRESAPAPAPVEADEMLVLWGAKDPVLPISTGEAIVRELGSRCTLVTLPEAGHFVIEEAPDAVRDILREFLAEPAPVEEPAPRKRAARPRKSTGS